MGITITNKFSTTNTTYSPGRKISYIVWHYTAGTTSKKGAALDSASWFANSVAQASADFIVDDCYVFQFPGDIENRYFCSFFFSPPPLLSSPLFPLPLFFFSLSLVRPNGLVNFALKFFFLFCDFS